MKQIKLASLLLVLSFPAGADETSCSIPGEPIHWVADYCMYKSETDDFENAGVQECFAQEVKREGDDCEIKSHYKMEICKMASRYFDDSWEKCMANESFSGSTVRDGGVGG